MSVKNNLEQFDSSRLLVSPSMLAADFARLGAELQRIDEAGADLVHLDVMDAHFVPNLSIGPGIIASLRPYSKRPFDVHLMLSDPLRYIDDYVKAGADIITFHIESESDPRETIKKIRSSGCSVGLSLKPKTPASALRDFLGDLDMILVMTVEPGFGGQSFMPEQMDKVRELRTMLDQAGNRRAHLQVDGGLGESNVALAAAAGANVIVAGTSVFRHPSGAAHAIARLHDAGQYLSR